MFYLWLALAGVAGTFARYWIGVSVQSWYGGPFSVATFGINVLGSFLFGLVWSLAVEKDLLSAEARTALLVGFLGAFTTFSTFAFDTRSFLASEQWMFAILNVLGQNVCGVLACILGIALARAF
jgi:CrcB protein